MSQQGIEHISRQDDEVQFLGGIVLAVIICRAVRDSGYMQNN